MNGLGQCQVCDNGHVSNSYRIDGKKMGVCSTCETELRKSGRLKPEVTA
ncbi:hypothetical protein [Natrinema salifodinae]|uniref:Uncharacterized protein n=1 Tax=Natrinema salifodinae TaxID=1202768 RepID=A0A1I0R0R6_9EURY|nr:hypothetical protein [Natrinema salifodinae]SEW33075.1 hypothetical protein SAMN05216285_4199 [Natrinema salifodinae]